MNGFSFCSAMDLLDSPDEICSESDDGEYIIFRSHTIIYFEMRAQGPEMSGRTGSGTGSSCMRVRVSKYSRAVIEGIIVG